jgi:hypothetical protein
MKDLVSILLLAFCLYSCDNSENVTALQFEYNESALLGKWLDLQGCEALMETDTGLILVEDRDIVFTFNEDNTYDLQNKDVCLDIFNNGSWIFNEQTNELVLDEHPVSSDSLVFVDGERKHLWEILNLVDDTLEVNHTYMYVPDIGEETVFTFFREFVRVE